ncbi:unnamed protein product [Acanthoscelides obtectus]|uniref:Uncharacterized protein n=2 Tax=Acanthoscelides obtectus TaxID=200917 RepID=A0A9P0L3Z7_ACAOB|nr:unnamed protein product [Acanthoscelides obtectus]CAK1669118.1 hypothetical protein AOBTE_LOCUS26812 [Acanthoscelides obtectus]
MRLIVLQFSLLLATAAVAYPARNSKGDATKVLYDQRQEGAWNVRADLDNFVILLIPTPMLAATTSPSSSSTSQPSSASLLDLLTKSLPKGARLKRVKHVKKHHQESESNESQVDSNEPVESNEPTATLETQHFIESKTAPYHVDISKTKTHLDVVDSSTEGLAKIWKNGPLKQKRNARAFLLTVPDEKIIVTLEQDTIGDEKKDVKNNVRKEENTLKLLGAEYEQCGPGLYRDTKGICRMYKNV